MELVYLGVEDYKNIKNQGFYFSPRINSKFDVKNLTSDDEFKDKDLSKRPFSKLIKDISEEIGIK